MTKNPGLHYRKKHKKKTAEAVNFLTPRAGSRSEDLETGSTDDHTVVISYEICGNHQVISANGCLSNQRGYDKNCIVSWCRQPEM